MAIIRFSKYHGLGNDFAIVDRRNLSAWTPNPQQIQQVCDRRLGIGADGILLLTDSDNSTARMQVLNADGSEAEMCGNGIRCVAKYLSDRDGASSPIAIDTGAGRLECAVTTVDRIAHSIKVAMGAPRFLRSEIPMTGPGNERCVDVAIDIGHREFRITAVSMGNPHAVCFVEETDQELLSLAKQFGPSLEKHEWFPNKTNAEYVFVHSPQELELVVWERGCGITQACGTGACATVAAACVNGFATTGVPVIVHLLGGDLAITVANDYSQVWMEGPAQHVFDGELPA